MNPGTIVLAGEIFVDYLMSGIDEWPQPGKETFAREFRKEVGGGTAITACALGKLGCAVEVLAVAGSDHSDWLRSRLGSFGVGTTALTIEDEPTGFTVVATRPEDRAFITYRGANRRFPERLQQWLENCDEPTKHLHVAAPLVLSNAEEILETLRSRSVTISLDVGWNEEWLGDPRCWEVVRKLDIYFPNHAEAARMTGAQHWPLIFDAFEDRGARRIALKLGHEGCALLWDGERHVLPPPRVRCVDTTGAGDCFDAGFLAAFVAGEAPLECARWANVCGALSTESVGGIEGAPTRARLLQELRRTDR